MRAVILGMLLISLPAAAQEIPNYDPVAHCQRTQATLNMNSQAMLNACLRQEQAAYDGLKARWDGLLPAIRTHCMRTSTTLSLSSYAMLNACVTQEEAARQQNQQFQFRR